MSCYSVVAHSQLAGLVSLTPHSSLLSPMVLVTSPLRDHLAQRAQHTSLLALCTGRVGPLFATVVRVCYIQSSNSSPSPCQYLPSAPSRRIPPVVIGVLEPLQMRPLPPPLVTHTPLVTLSHTLSHTPPHTSLSPAPWPQPPSQRRATPATLWRPPGWRSGQGLKMTSAPSTTHHSCVRTTGWTPARPSRPSMSAAWRGSNCRWAGGGCYAVSGGTLHPP